MGNVTITISSPYVGTEQTKDLGYTREDWDNLAEEDRQDIIDTAIFEYASFSLVADGEYIEP